MKSRVFYSIICVAVFGIVPAVQASILSTTGAVAVIAPPSDISTGAMENNTTIWAFAEQQHVVLSNDIAVDISVPGTSPFGGVKNLSLSAIAAGNQINSYFVHFDVVGAPSTQNAIPASGSITFDSDVLGILALSASLNLTDAYPGLSATTYSTDGGLEIVGGGAGTSSNDQITLSPDRRTVSFNLRDADSPDDIRIITTVPEPSSALLLAAGGAGLLAFLRRRRHR